MRRARGSGGRFLNTKKLDNTAANTTKSAGNNASCGDQQEGRVSVAENMHTTSNGNNGGNSLVSMYKPASREGNYFGQQRESMQGNGAPRGALSVN